MKKKQQDTCMTARLPWESAKTKQSAFMTGYKEGKSIGDADARAELKEKFQLYQQREQAIRLMNSIGQTIDSVNRMINP